jgi:hypothetical protein
MAEILHVYLHTSQEQFAKYLSEQKMFWIKVIEKSEMHTLCPVHVFYKLYNLQNN